MPGTIATVKAIVGQKVAKGDLLLTMEAMKMETSVRAESDGTVAEVLAKPGLQVDAKDLLVVSWVLAISDTIQPHLLNLEIAWHELMPPLVSLVAI